MKKIMKVTVAVMLLLAYCAVFMQGFAYSAITEEEIDAFLAEQGVPEIAVQKLPFDLKKRIYLGESQIEMGEPTYGVFTDDYRVEYTMENGRVVMDQQSRSQLRKLLNDDEAVANVLLSNEQAQAGQPVKLAANIRTEQDAMAVRKAEANTYRAANQEKIQDLKELSEEAVVRKISNWVSEMICIHTSYTNSISRKRILYAWEWKYSPFNTLADKAAIAWSGSFTGEPDSFEWLYLGYISTTDDVYYEQSGKNCTDYSPNSGIGVEIDLRSSHNGVSVQKHVGLIGVTLTKRTTENSRESAVGSYFHKYIALLPGGSLEFSGTGLSGSISIGLSFTYDKAPDAPCAFWAITGE